MRTPPIKLSRPNKDSNKRASDLVDRPIEEPNERAPDRVDRPIEEPNERTHALDNVPPILKPSERVSSPVPPILNSTIKFNEELKRPDPVARPNEYPNERAPDPVDRPNEEPNKRALDNVPPILKPSERMSSPVPPILNSTIKFNEELSEQPSKRMKGIHCRRKSIGRRKDGLQKKTGSYDFAGVRRSHGLHSSAPPQQVIRAVMMNRDTRRQDGDVRAPLKSELQRDLKVAMATNSKYAASIESLKEANLMQQDLLSLHKEKVNTLVASCNQLRGERRTSEKAFQTQLKEVGQETKQIKSLLTEENRFLRKLYSAEAKKRQELEAKSVHDDEKISNLKQANKQLMVDLLKERRASNMIIDEAMVEARRLSAKALEMTLEANAIRDKAEDRITKERNINLARLHMIRDKAEERIVTERNRFSVMLHQERAQHSRES
jgi:hypothetical protein